MKGSGIDWTLGPKYMDTSKNRLGLKDIWRWQKSPILLGAFRLGETLQHWPATPRRQGQKMSFLSREEETEELLTNAISVRAQIGHELSAMMGLILKSTRGIHASDLPERRWPVETPRIMHAE